jgi:hypothetical protein
MRSWYFGYSQRPPRQRLHNIGDWRPITLGRWQRADGAYVEARDLSDAEQSATGSNEEEDSLDPRCGPRAWMAFDSSGRRLMGRIPSRGWSPSPRLWKTAKEAMRALDREWPYR